MVKSTAKVSVETFLGVIIQSSILTVGLLHREFRPRDVMFSLDLVKNMFHHGLAGRAVDIQFIQIQRWLHRYVELGWVTAKTEGRVTTYKMKVSGFKGLLQALVAEDQLLEGSEALLIQQILDAYGPYLQERVLSGRNPSSAKDESLRELLKPGVVFVNQIKLLDHAIVTLERRMKESLRLQAYCKNALERGQSTEAIASSLPSDFSYKLSHQKPFKELLQEIPPALAEFEIREGFAHRNRRFFSPYLRYLKSQKSFYEDLLAEF